MSGKHILLLGLVTLGLMAFAACAGSDDDDAGRAVKAEAPPPPEGALAFASDSGITIAVTAISAELSSTTVVFEVLGRDDLGDSARVGEPMNDQNGGMVLPQTSRPDPANPRRVIMVYHPIPDAPGTVMAQIHRVEFTDRAASQTVMANNAPSKPTVIKGNWKLEIPFAGGQQPAVQAKVDASPAPFGPGSIETERAAVEGSELVVHGRVRGFSEFQIQSMKWSVALEAADGTRTAPTRFGYGHGEANSGFTLRFAAPPPGKYAVLVTLGAASHPYEPTAVAEMNAYSGQSARMTFELR